MPLTSKPTPAPPPHRPPRSNSPWPPRPWQANFAGFVSQFLGPDAVAEAEQLIAFDFRDYPTLGGGTQANFPPGVWTSSGKALREPHGRVHFAG